jgi:hypothetical protein
VAERPVGQVSHEVNSLADLRLSSETLDSILGHVGRIGVEALEGWDAAGTSLVEGDKVATYGSTSEKVDAVDRGQYDSGRGPCVDALGGHVQYFDGDEIKPEWRQFAETAGDAGIYSVMSFPLMIEEEVIGAINFYSSERQALRPGQREEGLLLAAQGAVAIYNARELMSKKAEVEQLSEGIKTRTIIGQATGLLMAQEALTSEEAFQKLVQISQKTNVKLREIAAGYVEAWENRQIPN